MEKYRLPRKKKKALKNKNKQLIKEYPFLHNENNLSQIKDELEDTIELGLDELNSFLKTEELDIDC